LANAVLEIEHLLPSFTGITLSEMDAVALMKRSDTKFTITIDQLRELLVDVSDEYHVLDIDGRRISTYRTEYFDTLDFRFFRDHLRGKAYRSKVRIRNYVESHKYFLEIKRKDKKGDTIKKRMIVDSFGTQSTEGQKEFVDASLGETLDLQHVFYNDFARVTLVGLETQERVTIDLNLTFEGKTKATYPGLVIVEVKQEGKLRKTPIVKSLKKVQARDTSVSKYCLGVIRLNITGRSNLYKEKMRSIHKLTEATWK
jgi:hypothetical protein